MRQNVSSVEFLQRVMLLATVDLAVNLLLHVNREDVAVQVGVLEVRAVAILALVVLGSAVVGLDVRFKVAGHEEYLAAGLAAELRRFVVNHVLCKAGLLLKTFPHSGHGDFLGGTTVGCNTSMWRFSL